MTLRSVFQLSNRGAGRLPNGRLDRAATGASLAPALERRDIGYCALLTIAALAIFLAAEAHARSFLYNLVTFDGHFYLNIARHGYSFSGNLQEKQNVSFLPLEAIAIFLADHLIPVASAFLKIALLGAIALFGILVGFFVLLQEKFGKDSARIAALVWTFSPMALYHFVGYTEPLFALATVWCLVALDRGWLWTASWVAGLALIGRPQAAVLVLFVGLEMLRRVNWRPWRLIELRPALELFLLFAPLMLYASWMALRFGDSALYANSMEAWRRGALVENFLPYFRALGYFFESVSAGSHLLILWTVMLCSVALVAIVLTLALSPAAPWRVVAMYLAFLAFFALVSSFEIKNIARHVFYLAPWAMIVGVALAKLPGAAWRKHAALIPFLLLSITINVVAIGRFYNGSWVS